MWFLLSSLIKDGELPTVGAAFLTKTIVVDGGMHCVKMEICLSNFLAEQHPTP